MRVIIKICSKKTSKQVFLMVFYCCVQFLQGSSKTFRVSLDPEIQTYADFRLAQQDVVEDLLKWIRKTYSD